MDSIELLLPDLYGTASEKLAAAKKISSLCVNIQVLEYVSQHDQLISALDRLLVASFAQLSDDGSSISDLGFTISKIILALSEVEDFHEILSNHRIGASLLHHLGSTNQKLISNLNGAEIESRDRRENFVIICLRILVNLAGNVGTLKKMIKKGLVPLIVSCLLNMKSRKSHIVSLQLLKVCSVFEETAIEIASHGQDVIPMLVRLLNNAPTKIHSDLISIMFNLSFLEECLDLISDVDGIHSCLVNKLQVESRTISLLYHLSSKEENRSKLFAAGISDYLIEEMKKATKQEMDEALAGLLVNVSRCVCFDPSFNCHFFSPSLCLTR